jgi:phage minor structural protein
MTRIGSLISGRQGGDKMYAILDQDLKMAGMLALEGSGCPFYDDLITTQVADDSGKLWNDTLSIKVPYGYPETEKMAEGYSLLHQGDDGRWYCYRINHVTDGIVGQVHVKQVSAVNLAIWELAHMQVEAGTFNNCSIKDAFSHCLQKTDWGIFENGFTGGTQNVTFNQGDTAQASLQAINTLYGCEIRAYVEIYNGRVVSRLMDIVDKLGEEKNFRIEYGHNLLDITREMVDDQLFTKLYVYGGTPSGSSNPISIAGANGGKDYIVDDAANDLYNFGGRYLEGFTQNTAMTNAAELLNWGEQQLALYNHPKYNYTVTTASLSFEANLGDQGYIIDTDMQPQLYLEARIIQKQTSEANPTNNQVVIGEFVEIRVVTPDDITRLQTQAAAINQIAVDAKNRASAAEAKADGKSTTYRSPDAPAEADVNDTWKKIADDGHVMAEFTYTADGWVETVNYDEINHNIEVITYSKNTVFGLSVQEPNYPITNDLWYRDNQDGTSTLLQYDGTKWVDHKEQAVQEVNDAIASLPRAIYSDTEPSTDGLADGSTWYETSVVDGKTVYEPHKLTDGAWVDVFDSTAQQAAEVAQSAQETADSRPNIFYGTATPTGEKNGDVWNQTNTTDDSVAVKQMINGVWEPIKGLQGPQGLQGEQGPKGDQGLQGPKGTDGQSSYAHIAYADNANGSGFSQDPSGKAYVGFYADHTATDSTDPTKYNWSLIKGADGSQGIQGPKGADGQTSYLHIAYANSADGATDFSTTASSGKSYIGQYTDFTASDSTDHTKYAWTKIKGDTGAQGPQGVPGPAGADGQPTYTWIKYATSTSGANMSDDPSGKTYIGIAYNKTTATESTNAADYQWALYQGPQGVQGPQGLQGTQGPAGATGPQGPAVYTWIKYADTPTSGISDDPTGKQYIGLAYNKTSATESTNYADYQWARLYDASKKRNFTSTPYTPYDAGDTWTQQGSTYYCTTARASGAYTASDWTLQKIVLGSLDSAVQASINGALQKSHSYKGVTIDDNGLKAVAGSTTVQVDSSNGFKIANGSTTMFQVDTSGNLNMRGNIVAGNISGVNFTGSSLVLAGTLSVTGALTAASNGVVVNSSGIAITKGSLNLQNTQIAADGTLTTTNANITGTVTVTGKSSDGSYNAQIKIAPSSNGSPISCTAVGDPNGHVTYMTSDLFKAYQSGNGGQQTEMSAGNVEVRDSSGNNSFMNTSSVYSSGTIQTPLASMTSDGSINGNYIVSSGDISAKGTIRADHYFKFNINPGGYAAIASDGSDSANLGAKSNISIDTWFGFSVCPSIGGMNVPQWMPAFVVNARDGDAIAYRDVRAEHGWVYGNASVMNGNIKQVDNSIFTTDGHEFIVSGGSSLWFGNDGSPRIYSSHIYNRTYGSGANMYITSSYTLGRSTSATKYKLGIKHDVTDEAAEKLLDLEPATWYDKTETEELANYYETGETGADDRRVHRNTGLIAEEVEAAGLAQFCEYSQPNKLGDREIEGIDYSKLWVLLLPIIKRMKKGYADQFALMKTEVELLKAARDNSLIEIAKLQKEVAKA